MFVHLADPDFAGHAFGWMSGAYGWAVGSADHQIGELLEAADRAFGPGEYTVIVTADHGGHGRNHGSDDPRDVTIPWIAWGKGVARGRTLPAGIRTFDTAVTALSLLGVDAEGYDDALLTTTEGVILEGPTFSVAWVVGGVLETPGLELGILDSITRRVMLEIAADLGVDVAQGTWPLDRLLEAEEVLALSTAREIQPVSIIGTMRFPEGAVTADLARRYYQRAY